jgi:hypothetical protein
VPDGRQLPNKGRKKGPPSDNQLKEATRRGRDEDEDEDGDEDGTKTRTKREQDEDEDED